MWKNRIFAGRYLHGFEISRKRATFFDFDTREIFKGVLCQPPTYAVSILDDPSRQVADISCEPLPIVGNLDAVLEGVGRAQTGDEHGVALLNS